jgi:hypothetical protein
VARLHGGLTCVDVEVVCGVHVPEDALARLILGDGQGRWTGVQIGYRGNLSLVNYMESLSELP